MDTTFESVDEIKYYSHEQPKLKIREPLYCNDLNNKDLYGNTTELYKVVKINALFGQ